MRALLVVLLLASCANLARVEASLRLRKLAGGWTSEHGDKIQIGCSGAFNADLAYLSVMPSHESGSHIAEVTKQGFRVSRWPLASVSYEVQEWPALDAQGIVRMRMEGHAWTRTRDLACD